MLGVLLINQVTSVFKIVAITENWLSKSIYDSEILPYNFVLFHKDRLSQGAASCYVYMIQFVVN